MKDIVIFSIIAILFIGVTPVLAETQILPTDKGTLDVRLSYDEIIPGELTTLNTDFLKPNSQEIQQHIDWSFTLLKDGKIIFGPTQLNHTSEGSLKNLRYEFEEKGPYQVEFRVEGILFQMIPTEKTTFEIIVGEPESIPQVSIDALTSKNFYNQGETVSVSGKIKNYNENIHYDLELTYSVLDPSEKVTAMGETKPSSSGAFNFTFVARGEGFEPSGSYSIQMSFGSSSSKLPLYLSGGQDKVVDKIPPTIIQHENIAVSAETIRSLTPVSFEVLVTDNVDKTIKSTCKPESGFLFGIGETIVKCTAKDSANNFASPMSFSVVVNPPVISIPDWVKNVAEFWCHSKIDDSSFIDGIQFLIDNGIIVIPATSEGDGETKEIPQWVKNNACWWSEGSISDLDFSLGIEYLIKRGIIEV